MSAYLAQHLPHLQSLHTQLALPAEALQADQDRIEAAIKDAVEGLLREREQQVDEFKHVIAGEKRRLGMLGRALGDKGRNVVDQGRRESGANETLPTQLELLVKQAEELEKVYHERLQHIEKQQSYLNQLAILLGAPFQPSLPLQPMPSGSAQIIPTAPGLARIVSGTSAGARLSGGGGPGGSSAATAGPSGRERSDSNSTNVVGRGDNAEERLFDINEGVVAELDGKVSEALAEREKRVISLQSSCSDLRSIHSELALPPIPISHPHHFPIHLLPTRSTEETPGAHQAYEKLLSKIVAEKVATTVTIAADGEELEIEGELTSLEGVEPEVGLMNWLVEVQELWDGEQSSRSARIQQLFDQIEPLWQRLQLDSDQMDLFIQMNMGCSEASIKAYEAELDRCYELRRSSLSSFIIGARAEIETLWTELMLSDEEKSDFGAFINDDYSEELLAEHEAYAEDLRAEVESRALLLPKVRDWHALVVEEEELERAQSDPDRYKRRGGAMLREEKLRKRVTILKPKIEQELLSMLPEWEESNGRPFMVQGERVVDKIHEAFEAKEAAKEAKKVSNLYRQGLAPNPPKPLAPTRTVRPTPSHSNPSRRVPSSASVMGSVSRKREAPTPTPMMLGGGNKRQKLIPGSVASSAASSIRAGSKIASMPSIRSNVNQTHGGASVSRGMGGRIMKRSSSPNLPPCGLPRPMAGTMSKIPSNTAHLARQAPAAIVQPVLSSTQSHGLPSLGHLAKANGRKPKRESFKPRQSLAVVKGIPVLVNFEDHDDDFGDGGRIDSGYNGMGDARMAGMGMMGLEEMVEEEGDVFE